MEKTNVSPAGKRLTVDCEMCGWEYLNSRRGIYSVHLHDKNCSLAYTAKSALPISDPCQDDTAPSLQLNMDENGMPVLRLTEQGMIKEAKGRSRPLLEPVHKNYENMQKRNQSFATFNRVNTGAFNTDRLVMGGFFFSGNENVTCFHCGISFVLDTEWDACEEHAIWSPFCAYLMQNVQRKAIHYVGHGRHFGGRRSRRTNDAIHSQATTETQTNGGERTSSSETGTVSMASQNDKGLDGNEKRYLNPKHESIYVEPIRVNAVLEKFPTEQTRYIVTETKNVQNRNMENEQNTELNLVEEAFSSGSMAEAKPKLTVADVACGRGEIGGECADNKRVARNFDLETINGTKGKRLS